MSSLSGICGTKADQIRLRQPALLILVHAEEEFDWNAPFAADNQSVTHASALDRLHMIFEDEGFPVTYLCDYPFIRDTVAADKIKTYLARGTAAFGAQLHSWVNPPHDEVVGNGTSFQCNLPAELELTKLSALTQQLEETFSVAPTAFLAGRYGMGTATPAALAKLGYKVNFSIDPGRDHRADGGPDYRNFTAEPFWDRCERTLLHIPHSAGYVGWRAGSAYSGPSCGDPLMRLLRATRLASKVGATSHQRLSPEGHSLANMKALTKALYSAGQRVFTFSLHSPTIVAGMTPYTQTQHDVDDFLKTCRAYLQFFRHHLGGAGIVADTLYAQLKD